MRLINLDDILKQFPKADFDGDNLENMKAYPHWKTDITGLFTILKSVPIIEACEDAISREKAIKQCGFGMTSLLIADCLKRLPSVTSSYNSVKSELKPCEDAIGREALVNELKCGYWNKELQSAKNDPCVIDAMIDWSIRTVKSQPSVKPQQENGEWIEVWDKDHLIILAYKCSECGSMRNTKTSYCADCGADMAESEG